MARTKHKARDNEVTDREQYATLVQSRLWRGRNLHILLNQRKGRKKKASKYEVLLANAFSFTMLQLGFLVLVHTVWRGLHMKGRVSALSDIITF